MGGFGIKNENTGGDAFDNYLDNLKQPKQNLNVEIEQDNQEIDSYLPDEITAEDLQHKKAALEASRFTADIVVETIDVAFVETIGFLAKLSKEDKQELKTDDETKENLSNAWANYLKDRGGELSPGVLLIILVLGVYAPKIPLAFELRKLKKQNSELTDELEEKDKEIAKLQKQLKNKK